MARMARFRNVRVLIRRLATLSMSPTVIAYANRICQPRGVNPEDVCATAFLKALRDIGRYDKSKGCPRQWFFRIVRNQALNEIKDASKWRNSSIDSPRDGDGPPKNLADDQQFPPEAIAQKSEDENLAHEALSALPLYLQQAVRARLEGMTLKDIAELLSVSSISKVDRRVRKGLKQLKITMQKHSGGATPGSLSATHLGAASDLASKSRDRNENREKSGFENARSRSRSPKER